MQLPLTSDNPAMAKRIEAYPDILPLERYVLHLLAVIYDYTARTHLLNALKKMVVPDVDVTSYKVKDLDPILYTLDHLGLVESEGNYYRCFAPFREPICRLLADHGAFDEFAVAVEEATVPTLNPSYAQILRDMRIAIYRQDVDAFHELFDEYDRYHAEQTPVQDHPMVVIFAAMFDAAWVRDHLPQDIQAAIAQPLTRYFQTFGKPPEPEILNFLMGFALIGESADAEEVRGYLAETLILDGRLMDAEAMVADDDGSMALLVRGVAAFLRGDNRAAIGWFETALKRLKKETRKRKVFFSSASGLFFILSLIKSGGKAHLEQAKTLIAIAIDKDNGTFMGARRALSVLIDARSGDPDALEYVRHWRVSAILEAPVPAMIHCLAVYWMDHRKGRGLVDPLTQLHAIAANNPGYGWVMAEAATLLGRLDGKNADPDVLRRSADFFERSGIVSIVDLVQPASRWEQALNALIDFNPGEDPSTNSDRSSRLVWLLDVEDGYDGWDLSPRIQVKKAGGNWSKGRKVALKRLYHDIDSFEFLTAQDRRVCAGLREERTYWHGYPDVSYEFTGKALEALVGHPLLFDAENPQIPQELVKQTPELMVNQQKNGRFELAFSDDVDLDDDVQLIRESPTRILLIETDEAVRRIAKIIGDGISVPVSGKRTLVKAVERISAILPVQAQLDGVGRSAQESPADPTPTIHLRPFGSGLKLDVWTQPFAPHGPCFRPGEGGQMVICDIDGQRRRTQRDLERERRLAERAVADCATLASAEMDTGAWEWTLEAPETCLEALMELNALEPPVVVKWPDGEPFSIRQEARMDQLFIRVKKTQDWFSVTGELKLDDGLVVSMERLLEMLEHAQGRFVRLDDGQFLALTEAFRKRLDEVAAYSKKSGRGRRFHRLIAPLFAEMAEDAGGFRTDRHWRDYLKRFEGAAELTPEIPSTFKAKLRDYQHDGVTWLARLAHWGVGACLADDMGLGKTIQALAAMLMHAAKGPSLVVAPTSVCMNWEAEARRFAPAFNIVTLGAGDREKAVADLAPFDLLVISYGLLQQEKVAGMLGGVHFEVIVLDEAQAIKNMTTKRSKAAMDLDGSFRLITTGTPIENHLGELWNLFRFINPGLLGSLKSFRATFATPIERDRDHMARRRLKKLVQPFILRRTKTQVLEELPQRTDILLRVELSAEEIAFYEALRRRALEILADETDAVDGQHLRILAQIMKLRRACCHPMLVLGDESLPSAKLRALGEIVDDLLDGGHQALVFSQFTSYLEIIRDYIEAKGVAYQYLDGSTPAKERQRRVAAFQGGDGDLFLISLKAGGVGLNLTAADYVIHMDPWWNPAVEDQASDRAHRIGQTRPVTVYSLIARDTIEEKIVDLHRSKRDLADSLLEGADMSGKIRADELLALIRDGGAGNCNT